ncbi:MAG: RidA family protein [Proteobacteria bacterium]|jgi:2-iminobutanoate/2-iminopropanoate deaminase|nr:MAG: RidA family protein [Pseudomonadota bacterium]
MAIKGSAYHIRALEHQFHYSQAVKSNGRLYISGTVSWDMESNPLHAGDMRGQVSAAYQELEKTLLENGADFSNVVKETVYTTNIEALAEANDIRMKFYEGVDPPAATWVEVRRLLHPDFLVEIELIVELA